MPFIWILVLLGLSASKEYFVEINVRDERIEITVVTFHLQISRAAVTASYGVFKHIGVFIGGVIDITWFAFIQRGVEKVSSPYQ